ncbi:MAG: hypothetical protein KY443_04550 [Actinobacteria bacterium]|nr:hypothetical protein [Actinomycetota bacterium]
MHDDPRLTSFMASVRDAYGASTPPAPGEELRALFATGLDVEATHTTTTSRRRRMFSDVFKAVPGKVAAGLLGATLAYTGLGAAGALPAPLSLASSHDDTEQVVLDDTTATTLADDGDTTPTTLTEGDGDGDAGAKVAEDIDLALVPVPTSVSEAAHNHAFDEACGNHGKYVSHFARTGTEPECATAARTAVGGDGQDTGTELSTADADADADTAVEGKGKGKGNGKAQKGKAKANHGKGKKGRS